MEFVIFIAALCALAFLAMRYGYDSRDLPYSEEQRLARFGMTWEVHSSRLDDLRREAVLWRRAQQVMPPPRRLRRRVALVLRALAHWLNPELAPYT
jgi:hypothetical protein